MNRNQGFVPSIINELMGLTNYVAEDRSSMPKMNVSENEKEYVLELCVPGLSRENFSLSVDSENNLVVEAMKQQEEAETNRRYLRREFGKVQFKQTMSLPDNVKKEAITASVENGILVVTLPKFSEDEKNAMLHRIEIK